jgi:hypothetical protein
MIIAKRLFNQQRLPATPRTKQHSITTTSNLTSNKNKNKAHMNKQIKETIKIP